MTSLLSVCLSVTLAVCCVRVFIYISAKVEDRFGSDFMGQLIFDRGPSGLLHYITCRSYPSKTGKYMPS